MGCRVASALSAVALAKEEEAIADTGQVFAKDAPWDFMIFDWLFRLRPASGTTPDKHRQPYTFNHNEVCFVIRCSRRFTSGVG